MNWAISKFYQQFVTRTVYFKANNELLNSAVVILEYLYDSRIFILLILKIKYIYDYFQTKLIYSRSVKVMKIVGTAYLFISVLNYT